ncbi:hypothetical protein HKX48_008883 [Thoreauomyces humboldtii]|nr:hypothetical protein HKX48_008883 [Thoreauomyces humboldtii]
MMGSVEPAVESMDIDRDIASLASAKSQQSSENHDETAEGAASLPSDRPTNYDTEAAPEEMAPVPSVETAAHTLPNGLEQKLPSEGSLEPTDHSGPGDQVNRVAEQGSANEHELTEKIPPSTPTSFDSHPASEHIGESVMTLPVTALSVGLSEHDEASGVKEANTLPAIQATPTPAFLDDLQLKSPEFPDSDEDLHSSFVTPLPNAPRYPVTVAFGQRSGWYIRWSDGTSGWESLPPTLHAKLNNRLPSLPGVHQLSMSDNNDWFVSFDDGSFATSGFPPRGKLWEALHNDADADVTNLVFAPGGGFILTREDGTTVWERLPTGLNDLLKRRQRSDPSVEYVAISKLGGWFIMFADRECVWEGLPPKLEKILIQTIRKNPPHLVVGLSPVEMMAYFVAVGSASDTNMDYATLRKALAWQRGAPLPDGSPAEKPEMNVNFTGPMPVPPVESEEYEDLFRRASVAESDIFADDDMNADDEIKSSVGGGGSVVEVKLPSGQASNIMNLDYAHVDGNVEAEEGGRLLLRAASTSLIDPKDMAGKNSRWNIMGGPGTTPTTTPVPGGDTPLNTPTTGISSFFSSVFGSLSTSKLDKVSAVPGSRGRSRGREDSSRSTNFGDSQNRSYNTSAHSPEDDDEYDGETDMMLDRVAQLKGQIQERLSELPNSSPYYFPLKRFSNSLDEHAYQLTSSRSAASAEQLAEAEYFVLYAEGWLEASEPSPLPNPWLNGWVEGKFGCSTEDVAEAVMKQAEQESFTLDGGIGSGRSLSHNDQSEQRTIDAHLLLSYAYEVEFCKATAATTSSHDSNEGSALPEVTDSQATHHLSPKTIHYTVATISEDVADAGGSIYHASTDLSRGAIPPPSLRVFEHDGRHYTIDNQHLWVVRAARLETVGCVMVEKDAFSWPDLQDWCGEPANGTSVVVSED